MTERHYIIAVELCFGKSDPQLRPHEDEDNVWVSYNGIRRAITCTVDPRIDRNAVFDALVDVAKGMVGTYCGIAPGSRICHARITMRIRCREQYSRPLREVDLEPGADGGAVAVDGCDYPDRCSPFFFDTTYAMHSEETSFQKALEKLEGETQAIEGYQDAMEELRLGIDSVDLDAWGRELGVGKRNGRKVNRYGAGGERI